MSEKLGKLVKEARTAKGLSQAALAEQAGISSSEVGKIERGEKEPTQAVLKLMAKALGVTQKSLLEAASGTGAASGKKPAAAKTASSAKNPSSAKTTSSAITTSSAKTGKASAKTGKASAKADAEIGTLTASEKKLVRLYRKADSGTKKAAVQLLSGEGNPLEVIGSMVMGKKEVSSMASGLLESILSGKGGASAGLTRANIDGNMDPESEDFADSGEN
ncbi:MAG: helix-turn-helix domain-containing protein [Eubacteriales bacterium]|nr:helix-turn-helix domain-containing protein [Eubacteriales bacterium]